MPFLRFRLLLVLLFSAASAAGEPTPASVPLTRIGDVRALSRDAAGRGIPVHVRGVVTWRGLREQIIVQDDTGGSWIQIPGARKRRLLTVDDATLNSIQVGHVLEIDGLTGAGGYAPDILPQTLQIVGMQPLPAARPFNPARFFSGAEANLRVAVRGVVQGFQTAELGWLLHLDANPGHFTVEFPQTALRDPAALVDAEVRITGVAVTRVNTRGEITMPRVFSSQPGELEIERPAAAPFDAPLLELDRLLPFRPEPIGPHRVRVIGNVTYALPGRFLYLQEDTGAVRIDTPSLEPFAPGDRVEAAGFVDMSRAVGTLTGALVRKIGRGNIPPAEAITPEAIIASNNAALLAGHMSEPHDFDGHLVHFPASLLAVQSPADPKQALRRLTLKRGDLILSAILYAGATADLDRLRPGSELEVTGIVQLEYTPVTAPRLSLVPTHLDIVLRNADDVRVLHSPSWWTAGRLLTAVVIVAIAFAAALVWVGQLRRQVRRKTEQLAHEIHARRDAAVEFQATLRERNRLAANLHDTLLQNLGGIGFQLGACEAAAAQTGQPGAPIAQLAVARRILDHAVKELRGSVWTLRSLPLHGKSLPEALQTTVEREGAGHAVRIDLNIAGDFSTVSEFVAGNLVLAAQEAVHNALKHGAPRVITLDAQITDRPAAIRLLIRDDGVGFTHGHQAGANEGHFGLVGMRERIERLDGTLRIESAPGQGTTVRLEVPLRPYDDTVG